MSVVKRYPSVASLLRPSQAVAYKIARWLVSSRDEDRRSGRSTVLAAAFLTEGLQGRSCRLWDHYAGPTQLGTFRLTLEGLADQAGLDATVDDKYVLRSVARRPDGLHSDEGKTVLLAETIKEAFRSGMSKEEILEVAERAIQEETVDQVHDL